MRLLLSLALMAILLTTTRAKEDHSTSRLKAQLEKMLQKEMGIYAIAYKNLQTGDMLFLNEKQMMHAASTMKVAVMIEVLRQAEAGIFSLDDSIAIINQFKSLIDGQPFAINVSQDSDDPVEQNIGGHMTIRELVWHMITISSNLATNLLVERVGVKNIQATVRALGAEQMEILRGVEDNLAYEKGLNNRTNAYDLLVLLEAIATEKAASPAACHEMLSIMLQQKFRDKIPALLPQEVRVAHKTGSISQINHDAGIVLLPDGRKYVLVVLSQGEPQQKKSSAVIAAISREIYQWMKGQR